MTIDGKVVAITGASSGIGEATAELLAERGAKLVAFTGASSGIGEATAELLAERGAKLVAFTGASSGIAVAARLSASGADVGAKVTDVSRRK